MDWLLENHEAIRNLGLVGAAAIGLPLAIWRSFIAQKQAKSAEEQTRIAAENHLAETYTKAIDQIGSEKEAIQLGGVYALEKIADSNREYNSQITEVLCAFVRLHAPLLIQNGNEEENIEDKNIQSPKEIIQTALTIIGRRNEDYRSLFYGEKPTVGIDLKFSNLPKVNLQGANLSRANLNGANLRGANLVRANLMRANLEKANLIDVNFQGADLIGARLEDANIKGADFNSATIDLIQIQPAKIYRSTKLPRKIDEKRLAFED